jgi:hypothetical protein
MREIFVLFGPCVFLLELPETVELVVPLEPEVVPSTTVN